MTAVFLVDHLDIAVFKSVAVCNFSSGVFGTIIDDNDFDIFSKTD